MASFIDVRGELWIVPEFTLGLIRKIKAETSVNLIANSTEKDVKQASVDWYVQLHDPELLGGVLWVVLQSDIGKRGLDYDGFASRFSGVTLDKARDAIIESLLVFTRTPEVAEKMMAELPRVKKAMNAVVITQWKATVGSLEESVASMRESSV